VAVILSAQCTDKRVNIVTPTLFERYPTPQDMAKSSVEEIYSFIKSISYPNNKAKNLWAMARKLVDEFGGELPRDLEQLQELPILQDPIKFQQLSIPQDLKLLQDLQILQFQNSMRFLYCPCPACGEVCTAFR
jgi:hypothetical protein